MNAKREGHKRDGADIHLLDVVSAALIDPNLHTDARLRLHGELTELIESARQGLTGPSISEAPTLSPEPPDGELEQVLAARELTEVLSAVLVDPSLHTDTRLRLHEQIPELIRAAHQAATAR